MAACLRPVACVRPTQRWRHRPLRRPARGLPRHAPDRPPCTGCASPRISRAWPAVTTRSPAASPSSISTLPGRRTPMRASMRCEHLALRPIDHLHQELLAALRHQRLLGHDQRVVAPCEHDARAREQPGLAARRPGCPAARAPAASGRWHRPANPVPRCGRRSAARRIASSVTSTAWPGLTCAMKRSGRRKSTHICERSSMLTRSAPSLT